MNTRLSTDLRTTYAHLSDAAFRAHVEATAMCSAELTDGFVSKDAAKTWGKAVAELSAAGVWNTVEGGFRIKDYLDSNPKASTVQHARDVARQRMRRARKSGPPPPSRGMKGSLGVPDERDSRRSAKGSSAGATSGRVERPAPPAPPPEALELCNLLADLIEANGSKRPTVTEKWKKAARLILEKDKRPLEEARALIEWAQADDFWQSNIMSMPKFRTQYDRLRLRAQNGRGDLAADIFDEADREEHTTEQGRLM